jgi:hypothetical protein
MCTIMAAPARCFNGVFVTVGGCRYRLPKKNRMSPSPIYIGANATGWLSFYDPARTEQKARGSYRRPYPFTQPDQLRPGRCLSYDRACQRPSCGWLDNQTCSKATSDPLATRKRIIAINITMYLARLRCLGMPRHFHVEPHREPGRCRARRRGRDRPLEHIVG